MVLGHEQHYVYTRGGCSAYACVHRGSMLSRGLGIDTPCASQAETLRLVNMVV